MQFYISSLTGTTSHSKKYEDNRPGISFFICYRKNASANQLVVFQHLHDAGMEATVKEIQTKDGNSSAYDSLKVVVKVT